MIVVNPFVKRQTPESPFSHFEGSWDDLVLMVDMAWKNRRPGDRDGVWLVSVPPHRFYTGLVRLREGDRLVGTFEPRQNGELPTKQIRALGQKAPAKRVEIVLYSSELLAEDACRQGAWEIISINAQPDEIEAPITVGALMRNYFDETGGTKGDMTQDEFVKQLKVSRDYWRDYCMVAIE